MQCGGSFHPNAQSVGPPGPAGPQGPAGPTGPTGATGPQGPIGPLPTLYFTNTNGQPPVFVDQVTDPFGDPRAILSKLRLPTGNAYYIAAKTIGAYGTTATNNPSFGCFLWYNSPDFHKIDGFSSSVQIRNDGTQNSTPLLLHGPSIVLPSSLGTVDVNLSCATPAGTFPLAGQLGFYNTEISALPVGGVVQQCLTQPLPCPAP